MPSRIFALAAAALLIGAPLSPGFAQSSAAKPVAEPALQVDLAADPANPAMPKMGDRLLYRSTIRNTGTTPVGAVLAWLGLVQVDPGQEQPVDLEDWSAQKAITVPQLAPGQAVTIEWPMRLIASGHYRVVVTAAAGAGVLAPSPFVDLAIRQKPVVESDRVLPVALGIPALLLGGLVLLRRRNAGGGT
jgi:hypothetical protein